MRDLDIVLTDGVEKVSILEISPRQNQRERTSEMSKLLITRKKNWAFRGVEKILQSL